MKESATPSLFETDNSLENSLAIIRTETALSRFPMHRLTKGQEIQIELKNRGGAVYWNVSPNSKYGQPGQLAYKIDTLIVNRRIEEAGRPVPKIIRLGTLAEIAGELGSSSHNTATIKQALSQNATATITAEISYRTGENRPGEKGHKTLKAIFSRYSIIFTGESLPDGQSADAVYLVLNDVFQEILNNAVFRPLDYDYMKSLPPAAQRFYEIVSYQIFAAVHHGNPRARLLYSEFCASSPAPRYAEFDQVKKQMYKVHRPHVESGYIAKVSYEATTNSAGELDWWIYYTPGENAGREYQNFTGVKKLPRKSKKSGETLVEDNLALPLDESATPKPQSEEKIPAPPVEPEAPKQIAPDAVDSPQTLELIESLVKSGLNRADAVRFAREVPDVCRRQIAFLPFVEKFKTSRGAFLRRAIEGDYGPPAAFTQAQEQEAAKQSAKARKAREMFEAAQEKARNAHYERFKPLFAVWVGERVKILENGHSGAFTAFLEHEREKLQSLVRSPLADRPMFRHSIENFDNPEMRADRFAAWCQNEGREFGISLPSFWEWDATENETPFQN